MRYTAPSFFKSGLVCVLAILLSGIASSTSFGQTSSKTNSAVTKMIGPVDVNSADLKTLETLPGVGPSVAKKIVDGRPYSSLADLQKVKGLSKSRVDAMKDLVSFGSAPATNITAAATAPAKKAKKSATTAASASSTAASPPATTGSATGSSHASAPPAGTLAAGEKVNINTASAADLDKIPGIGPTKAQAIVDYRTQNGNFKSVEDIEKVKGIKSGVYSKIKDYIKVSD